MNHCIHWLAARINTRWSGDGEEGCSSLRCECGGGQKGKALSFSFYLSFFLILSPSFLSIVSKML